MSNKNQPHHGTGIITEVPNVGILQAYGNTVPTDASRGYATGCIFHHTDGGNGTSLYTNEGTLASCSFKAIDGT
jgi:hypothetical protein